MKIYVTHYTKLTYRKKILQHRFDQQKITNVEWVENWDKEDISESVISQYVDLNPDSVCKRFKFEGYKYLPIKISEISLVLKHIECWKRFLQSEEGTCLILEDDVILAENFIEKLNSRLVSAPNDYDAIFIGQGTDYRIPESDIKEGQYFYFKEHPAAKCADSYILKKETADKLIKEILPFSSAADRELCYLFDKLNMKIYWMEPPLVDQGSQSGLFQSSLQDFTSKYTRNRIKNIEDR
jgi:GR25 family glycosyltransferase involved in LPS biosynthesis